MNFRWGGNIISSPTKGKKKFNSSEYKPDGL